MYKLIERNILGNILSSILYAQAYALLLYVCREYLLLYVCREYKITVHTLTCPTKFFKNELIEGNWL